MHTMSLYLIALRLSASLLSTPLLPHSQFSFQCNVNITQWKDSLGL